MAELAPVADRYLDAGIGIAPPLAGITDPGQSSATVGTQAFDGVRVAMLGDSLTTYNNMFITPTTLVRKNGVAIVGFTAHGLGSGSSIRVYSVKSDPSFNVSDAVATRIDANFFTYPNPGPDAVATIDVTYTRIIYKSWYTNVSPFLYLNSVLRGALLLVDNFGQSSETTTQILARTYAQISSSTADTVIYLGGSNDGAQTPTPVPAATTIANDAAIAKIILGLGKQLVLCSIPPLGTGHPQFAQATPLYMQVNMARRQLARTSRGRIKFVDLRAALVAPATGGAVTNALQAADNIHWQTYGGKLAGKELAKAFASTTPGRILTTSIADSKATYASSPGLWPVGQFSQTSAGTKSGPTDAASPPGGSVAGVLAGYNVTATAGSGEVYMAPDDDGYGYGQVCTWTPSGAGTVTIQQQSAATMAALVSPGEFYRVGFHLKVAGVTNALTFLRCRIQGIFDGVTQVIGTPMHSIVGASGNVGADFDEYIVSPGMPIPPFTSCTSLTLEVIANFSGATTLHTITVSRMTFDKVA